MSGTIISREYTPVGDIHGVGNGQTAIIDLKDVVGNNLTLNYLALQVKMSGLTLTEPTPISSSWMAQHLLEIRHKINGKVRRVQKGDDVVMLNAYNRGQWISGYLPLNWREPNIDFSPMQDQLALGTENISSYIIEIDFKDSGGYQYHVDVHANTTPIAKTAGVVKLFEKLNLTGVAEGKQQIDHLLRGNNGNIVGIHLKTDKIGQIELKSDRREILNMSRALMHADIITEGNKTPQDGWTHIDLSEKGRLHEALPVAVKTSKGFRQANLDLTLEFLSGVDAQIHGFVEYVANLDQL